MKVTNPLLPGVYAIDIKPELAPAFGQWRRAQRGKVHVVGVEPAGERARVAFVVFRKPGAFPLGKLGAPVRGTVGALPDWKDVAAFVIDPLGKVEQLAAKPITDLLAELVRTHSAQEISDFQAAMAVTRANIAVIAAQLAAVRAGTAPNPSAVMFNAAAMVKQSIELLTRTAGAIPGNFPRHAVNALLEALGKLGDAIAAAPGKALHALTRFPAAYADNVLKPFVLPAEGALLGLALLAGGAYLSYEQGHTTPLSRNLMIAGGAVALLGGGLFLHNVDNALPRDPT